MNPAGWCGPVVLIACLSGCGTPVADYAVGTLERDRIELAAFSTEPIRMIRVQEGDRVPAGTALLEQDTAKLDVALSRARADRDRALAVLREAEAGPRAQEIERARSRLAAASSALQTARHELERQQSLVSANYTSRSQIDISTSQVDEALARREEIEAQLAELLEGTRSEQVDQARAAYTAASALVEDLEIDLSRAVLRAPVDALVEALPYEIGERPQAGRSAVVLLDASRLYARVHIPEPQRTLLKTGAPAQLRVDGHPEDFAGRIRWIASAAAFTPFYALTQHDRSRLVYLAEVDILEPADLPVGVPVEVRFPDSESLLPDTESLLSDSESLPSG
ncbi:MAG: HlyD family efflux transporter periplasmic adaptor subunit [Pseudomonadales bacterium]